MSDEKKKYKSRENYDGVSKLLVDMQKKESTKMAKKDWISFLVVLGIVIIFTFINLGSLVAPTTTYTTSADESFIIYELPEKTAAGDLYLNFNINEASECTVKVYTSDTYSTASSKWTYKKTLTIKGSTMFRYENYYSFEGKSTSYVILVFNKANTVLNEVVLTYNNTKEVVPLKVAYVSDENIENSNKTIDEQDTFKGGYNNFNGMYFDEIYHARTAYEFINGLTIYEWTHPPLGKLIISVGILIFGMNPFGYRIMGALFSIATVVVMYFLGKKVFKNNKFAIIMMLLSAFEGLRFTLGRISTVDSFLGFFIITSFYFMYSFFEKGIDMEHIVKSLIPFALSGIFFGLAFSTKWNGAYAGLGLLILFIIALVRICKQFAKSKESVNDGEYLQSDKLYVKKFPIAIVATILFGLIFFIAIPFAIYFFQFAIFQRCGAEGTLWQIFIEQNKAIFSYHSALNATHQSASPWWSWILNGKSVFLALSDSYYGTGIYSRVHCMMTTATSVFGIWAIVYFIAFIIKYLSHKKKQILTNDESALMNKIKTPLIFFGVGFLANWIPWAFISRIAYIYHFYASCTFMLGLIALFLYTKTILERDIAYSGELAILNGKKKDITRGNIYVFVFLAIYIVNFLLFWPVFSGLPVGSVAAVFMFGWANGFWEVGLFPTI